MKQCTVATGDIVSERELYSKDGFTSRRGHYPDFVYSEDGTSLCVEVELSLKNKARLRKNIQQNIIEYDYQIWVVPKSDTAIRKVLDDSKTAYPNIEVMDLENIREYIKERSGLYAETPKKSILSEIGKIESQKQKLVELYYIDGITKDDFKKLTDGHNANLNVLHRQLTEISKAT